MSEAYFARHVAAAKQAEADGKVHLAVREWREATRIRPNSAAARELSRVESLLSLNPSVQTVQMAKFSAQFNLAVYYWDCGRAGLALSEARKAVESFGEVFPGENPGCARHHILAIQRAQQVPQASAKNHYSRGVGFYDKRMLRAAENEFSHAIEEAKLKRDKTRVEGLADDLKFVMEMKDEFCKQQGPLLPCLLSRFAQPGEPCLEECRQWGIRQMFARSGLLRKATVTINFKLKDGSIKSVQSPPGISVLKAAHMFDVELEGACEESLACSTCHVMLEDAVFKKIPAASEREEDLLDLAPSLTSTSRLGCQIIVDTLLEGAVISLPKTTVNFYVDGHVPKPH